LKSKGETHTLAKKGTGDRQKKKKKKNRLVPGEPAMGDHKTSEQRVGEGGKQKQGEGVVLE